MDAATDGPSPSPPDDSGSPPRETRSKRGDRGADGRFAAGNQYRFELGNGGGPGRPRSCFGEYSRQLDARTAADFAWSRREAKALGLDPAELTIGELMVHACKAHAIEGKVGYLVEDNNRREGKVPEHIRAAVTFELTDEQRRRAERIAQRFDAIDD